MICSCGWLMKLDGDKIRCEMCDAEIFEFWINGVQVDAEIFYGAQSPIPTDPNFAGFAPRTALDSVSCFCKSS